MKTALQGSFPKIPAGPGPSVRSAINRFERGQIGPRELDATFRQVTERVLRLAEEHRIDRTTDGQIRWNDLFDPLVRDVDNVSAEGLLRLYDNNFYYRHPVIRGYVQFQGGTLAEWTRQALRMTRLPLKVALPGPFTFLDLSEDLTYHRRERLLADWIEILQLEVESLAELGVAEIQWDEPSLTRGQFTVSEVVEGMTQLKQGISAPVAQSLALYWGPSANWLEPMASLGWDAIYLDFVADPGLWKVAQSTRLPFVLGVGAIDARDARLEEPTQLAQQLEPVLARQGQERVILCPTSGLELLPPDRAIAKVECLAKTRDLVTGRSPVQ
ncbi:MAG: synthase [Firmicutes bacterium]|nr:synthase [Bacillota bacterium]